MLEVDRIRKTFGDDLILEEASFTVRPRERVAFVGRNGTGKSTLLKIIAGYVEPDSGRVSLPRGAGVAYLPQDGVAVSSRPLVDEVSSVFDDVRAMEAEQRALEGRMHALAPDDPSLHDLIERHHALQTEFERREGDKTEAKVGTVLAGLGFRMDDYQKPLDTFSGGWQMRAALAKLLLREADLLLLDEPTNHLDLVAVEWLEEYLQRYRGAVLIVSHDRYFLDRATTRTIELVDGRIEEYAGTYSWFVVERERRFAAQQSAFERQQGYFEQQNAYIEKFRYSAKRSSQVKSREKMLDKIERVEAPKRQADLVFRLPTCPPSGMDVVSVRNATKSYPLANGDGANVVLRDSELLVRQGEKIGFVGPNGAGKSTLLRLIAKVEKPDRGYVVYGPSVQAAYFAQHQAESLNPANTILDEVYGVARQGTLTVQIRNLLGQLLFRQDEVFKRIDTLSGGERSRVALAKMLLRPANLLLLDEPTNHLDVAAKEIIERALRDYPGTVVVASHDRYFLDQFVTRTIEVRDAGLTTYLGNYTFYRERRQAEILAGAFGYAEREPALVRGEALASRTERIETNGNGENRRAARATEVAAQRRKRETQLRRELEAIELEIAELNERIVALADELAHPDAYAGGQRPDALVEYETATARLTEINSRWEELVEEL